MLRTSFKPFSSALPAAIGSATKGCAETAALTRWLHLEGSNHPAMPHMVDSQGHHQHNAVPGHPASPGSPIKSHRQLTPSPWTLQFSSHLASSAQAAPATPQALALHSYSGSNTESTLVEEWLFELAQLRSEVRSVCAQLLSRHPALLYADPVRITQTVQVLADAVRDKGLLRPWFFSDKLVLQLVERYNPETLRARLSQLHADVWAHLDDEAAVSLAYLNSSRSSPAMDLLDLDARALAAKAHKLRGLVPHFTPSTLLRAVPELQDVAPEELARTLQRAGLVVAAAASPAVARRFELRAQPDDTVQLVMLTSPSSISTSPSAPYFGNIHASLHGHYMGAYQPALLAGVPPASTVTRRIGVSNVSTSAVAADAAMATSPREEPGEVVATFPNTRMIVYIDADMSVDVRFEAQAAPAVVADVAASDVELSPSASAYVRLTAVGL